MCQREQSRGSGLRVRLPVVARLSPPRLVACLAPGRQCIVPPIDGAGSPAEGRNDEVDGVTRNSRIARVERRTGPKVLQPGTREVDEPGSDW